MLKTFILKNGLKVATYSIPEMKSVFLEITVKGGSIFETLGQEGVAHLMEHLLVQGIPSLPNVEVFSNFIEGLAGSYNAATYPQSIRFNISAPASHVENILMIAGEAFFEPLFAPQAIEREKGVILEEIRQKQDALWYKNYRFFASVRFKPAHPLLLESGGTEKSIKKLNRNDLVRYWSRFFFPKNTYLALVGGFKNEQAEKMVKGFFDKYHPSKNFPGFPNFTNQDLSGKRVAIRKDKTLQSCYVDLSFPSLPSDVPLKERLSRSIVKNILGNLRGSRLYSLLRQKRGLVYDVGVNSASYQRFAYADIYFQTAVENLEEVTNLVVQELSSFVLDGPTDEEVSFAKNHYVNRNLMQWDHPGAIGSWISSDLMWEEKVYIPEEYVKMIEGVDRKMVVDFIKKYWDFSKVNLVIQGPIENSSKNVEKFKKIIENLDLLY